MDNTDLEERKEPGEKRNKASSGVLSLRWKILLWIVLIAMTPLVIMSYQGYHCARQALIETQSNNLRTMANYRVSRIEGVMDRIKADLSFLVRTECALREEALEDKRNYDKFSKTGCDLINHMQIRRSLYRKIVTFDREWNRIFETVQNDQSGGVFKIPRDFRKRLEKSETSEILWNNEKVLAGRSIPSSDSKNRGYVVAEVKLDDMVEPAVENRIGLGKTGKVLLVDKEGKPLISSGESQSDKIPVDKLTGESKRTYEYGGVLGVSASIAGVDRMLVVQVTKQEVFSWLYILRFRAVVTGIITLIFVVLLSLWISGKLSEPLSRLSEVAGKIARGDHEKRLNTMDSKEAEKVRTAFNRMLDELQAREEKLIQTASLAAVGEVSSGIVHEMRNPLSTVKLNIEALREKVEGEPRYEELAEIAKKQTDRLEEMTSDLLNYGEPLNIEKQSESLKNIIDEIRKTLDDRIKAKNIRLKVEDIEITVDREQMKRAFINLLENALRVSPEGGKISVKSDYTEDGNPRIRVEDEGPGIPESEREDIFRPFFSTSEEGTGLGLANVKKIIDYHGGDIEVENLPGNGAVFTVILPENDK